MSGRARTVCRLSRCSIITPTLRPALRRTAAAFMRPPCLALSSTGRPGDDRTFWGGEFLLADYSGDRRLGAFKPVVMPGAGAGGEGTLAQSLRPPQCRNGRPEFSSKFSGLELHDYLLRKPRRSERMIRRGINTPLASSCGRLFDAVAAAYVLLPTAKPMKRATRPCISKQSPTTPRWHL